jgi:nucleotide-binding universal stress UspA family protein
MQPLLTTILLATDGSPAADEAGRAALALADLTGAALHVVQAWHVPEEHDARSVAPIDRAYVAALYEEQARTSLAAALERLALAGANVAGAQLGHGRPVATVLAEAATVGADLIVTGSRGAGPAKRVLLGSVAEGIVRGANCPVLVVRGDDMTWPPARIVVGVDGAQEAQRAEELAARIAAPAHATVVLLRAVPALPPAEDPSAQDHGKVAQFQAAALKRAEAELAREADALTPLLGARPTICATVEDADIALLRVAEEGTGPTLIAVGTRGTAPAGQLWLGSTALRVLTCASGSVLVCPHRAVLQE